VRRCRCRPREEVPDPSIDGVAHVAEGVEGALHQREVVRLVDVLQQLGHQARPLVLGQVDRRNGCHRLPPAPPGLSVRRPPTCTYSVHAYVHYPRIGTCSHTTHKHTHPHPHTHTPAQRCGRLGRSESPGRAVSACAHPHHRQLVPSVDGRRTRTSARMVPCTSCVSDAHFWSIKACCSSLCPDRQGRDLGQCPSRRADVGAGVLWTRACS
jgi:hypothetical protein